MIEGVVNAAYEAVVSLSLSRPASSWASVTVGSSVRLGDAILRRWAASASSCWAMNNRIALWSGHPRLSALISMLLSSQL